MKMSENRPNQPDNASATGSGNDDEVIAHSDPAVPGTPITVGGDGGSVTGTPITVGGDGNPESGSGGGNQ